jgi:hypothetical protein
MSAVPPGPAKSASARVRARPAVILTAMAGITAIVAVLAPQGASQDPGLTTHSAGPGGGRIAFELADRLGWETQQRDTVVRSPTPPIVAHAVLAPEDRLSGSEVHALLESVRGGGGLIIAGIASPLRDSLGYGQSGFGRLQASDEEGCPAGQSAVGAALRIPAIGAGVSWRRPPPSEPVVFASILSEDNDDKGPRRVPAIVGVRLGAGRIVIVGSGTFLQNDIIRQCRVGADIAYVRALEFVRGGASGAGGGPRILVFDEYHHGRGAHPGSVRAISGFVARTPPGHALLQGMIGGLILLLAAAPRAIMPRDPERIARRSPLEHADALAHAYATVKASRTVTARLLSGVRRRAGVSRAGRDLDDTRFLSRVAADDPSLAADVEIVRHGLAHPVPPRQLPTVAAALERIESALGRRRTPTL